MLTTAQQRVFDGLLDRVVDELPPDLRELLEEVPLIVEDEPSAALLEQMQIDPAHTDLCGLHWGTPLTERSVAHGSALPDRMMLFRGSIMRVAAYRGGRSRRALSGLERQIRVTVLHEIGHHFGLDEPGLAKLGYG